MSIGITNRDSSFFSIKSLDARGSVINENQDFNKDLISLNVTEEVGKRTTGNIKFLDNDNIYNRILREGVLLEISWGYGDIDETTIKAKDRNPSEYTGDTARRGFRVKCYNPAGNGGANGVRTYSMNFVDQVDQGYGVEFKKFEKIYKGQLVLDVMRNLLRVDKSIIDFKQKIILSWNKHR